MSETMTTPDTALPAVRLDRRGRIAILTIDRPQAANAFGPEAVVRFRAHLAALREDQAIAGLVVTGAGTRHFCSGGDVKVYADYTGAAELDPVFDDARAVLDELDMIDVPTVAAINGVAIGGGAELALACDFRIARRDVTLSLPQVRMGIMPGWYAAERLLAVCGRANAKRIMLSGRRFTAEEALGLGAVDEIVDGDVVDAAVAFLLQFEGANRRGIAGVKRVIQELADNGRDAGRRLERHVFAELWFHPDRKR